MRAGLAWVIPTMIALSCPFAVLHVATAGSTARAGDAGSTAPVHDGRSPIALSDEEIAFVRREMRGLLESAREVLEAASAADRDRLVKAAQRAGMNGPESEHIPKSLAPKLPMDFKKLGLATHRAFDQIAADAAQGGPLDKPPRQLGALMANCVTCHATWRIVSERQR